MIALDTNILIRFLIRDDEGQARAAAALLQALTVEEPGYVSRDVTIELVWVLKNRYGFRRERLATVFNDLLNSEALEVEAAGDLARAAREYRRGGADLADRMIAAAARRAGAVPLYTFDRKAARLPDVTLVEEPLQPASRSSSRTRGC